MREAEAWAEAHALTPGAHDSFRCCFVAIDVQNMFCIPGFELFVVGRSGTGAVDDTAASASSSIAPRNDHARAGQPRHPPRHRSRGRAVDLQRDRRGRQAKSHCLAWTIDDLLADESAGGRLAKRTCLLEECTSPVVVPGAVDYTEEADAVTSRRACTSSPRPIPWRPGPAWPTASADS
jgi:nicotinamidase-related amidase